MKPRIVNVISCSSALRPTPVGRVLVGQLLAVLFFFPITDLAIAADPLELEQGDQPNHLEPVSPSMDVQLIEKKLLLTSGDYGRMIIVPSFGGITAVSVYGSDFTDVYPKQPRSFHIAVSKADKSLYSSLSKDRQKSRRHILARNVPGVSDAPHALLSVPGGFPQTAHWIPGP